MDTKQLKQKILDLAIRGKLVPQDSNDEPASVLLERIRKEKEQLIAAGKLKKSKAKASDTPHYENVPFEIPDSWEWVTLPDLCTIPITDGTHQTPTYAEKQDGIPFLSSKDVTTGKINWSDIKYITKELHQELYKRVAPQRNDILLAKNGTTGVAALVDTDIVFDIYVTLALIRPVKYILPQYLLYVINSHFCKEQFNDHLTGIGLPNLHLRDINKTFIPLPPFEEQKRIVDKLNNWFEHIENLDTNREELQRFIQQTKSKILSYAISGKLVSQDPSDEPAIDLLRRINPSFTPCDTSHYENLPQGWTVASVDQLCTVIGGLWTGKKPPFVNIGVIRNTNFTKDFKLDLANTAYLDVEAKQFATRRLQQGDIILEKSGGSEKQPVGRTILFDLKEGEYSFSNFTAVLRIKDKNILLPKYLHFALVNAYLNGATRFMQKQTTGIHNLIMDKYVALTIPIPPLAEQKRIVVAIENVFQKLDKITAEL